MCSQPLLADDAVRPYSFSCAKPERHGSPHSVLCSCFLQESNQFPAEQCQEFSLTRARINRKKAFSLQRQWWPLITKMYHRKKPPYPVSTLWIAEIARPPILSVWLHSTRKVKRKVRHPHHHVAEVKGRDQDNQHLWKSPGEQNQASTPNKLPLQVRSSGQLLFSMEVELKCFKSLQNLH